MKIYFCGDIEGSYRAQNMLKSVADAGIPFTYVAHAALRTCSADNRYLRFLLTKFLRSIFLPARLMLILAATHVVVLPMSFSFAVICEVLMARLLQKKIVVDYYVSIYDTSVNDRNTAKPGSLRAKLYQWKDRILINSASKLIFLNRSEREYYLALANVDTKENRVSIIPLCVDYKKETLDVRTKRPKPDRAIQQENSFRVCWWGTYIPLHGLENLINAIALSKNKSVTLYVFGDSDVKAREHEDLVDELGVRERVVFDNTSTFVNGKLGPWLAENCDLAVGNFGSSEKARTVLVNKIVDAMAMGLPCLTMKTKACVELLDTHECLYYCENSPPDIAETLDNLCESSERLNAMAERGFKAYLELFSPEVFRDKFLASLYSV